MRVGLAAVLVTSLFSCPLLYHELQRRGWRLHWRASLSRFSHSRAPWHRDDADSFCIAAAFSFPFVFWFPFNRANALPSRGGHCESSPKQKRQFVSIKQMYFVRSLWETKQTYPRCSAYPRIGPSRGRPDGSLSYCAPCAHISESQRKPHVSQKAKRTASLLSPHF